MRHTEDTPATRRQFARTIGGALASTVFTNLRVFAAQGARDGNSRLTARPLLDARTSLASGALGLGRNGRDGLLQIPSVTSEGKIPLLVFLHGATQNGAGMLRRIGPVADQLGIAVLAPDSRAGTWDAIRSGFGEDVEFINGALEVVFERLAVDPARVAIGGFSDGASYALSLGLANGDLFPHIVACSPGYVIRSTRQGQPRVFISHGISDQILPIDRCSRVIVPQLQALGYDVTYREFEGRHELPPAIAREALGTIAK